MVLIPQNKNFEKNIWKVPEIRQEIRYLQNIKKNPQKFQTDDKSLEFVEGILCK